MVGKGKMETFEEHLTCTCYHKEATALSSRVPVGIGSGQFPLRFWMQTNVYSSNLLTSSILGGKSFATAAGGGVCVCADRACADHHKPQLSRKAF